MQCRHCCAVPCCVVLCRAVLCCATLRRAAPYYVCLFCCAVLCRALLQGANNKKAEHTHCVTQSNRLITLLRHLKSTNKERGHNHALTATMRSNLPGRLSAGSNTSARFVAANTMTAVLLSKPSISWGGNERSGTEKSAEGKGD